MAGIILNPLTQALDEPWSLHPCLGMISSPQTFPMTLGLCVLVATSWGRAGDTELVVTLPLPLCDLGKITPCPHPSVLLWKTGTAQALCLTWVQAELLRTLGTGGTGGGGSGITL